MTALPIASIVIGVRHRCNLGARRCPDVATARLRQEGGRMTAATITLVARWPSEPDALLPANVCAAIDVGIMDEFCAWAAARCRRWLNFSDAMDHRERDESNLETSVPGLLFGDRSVPDDAGRAA